MSDVDTLKSFLVSVGFKLDDQSFKKLNESLDKTTKSVEGFDWSLGIGLAGAAAAAVAAAATVAVAVEKMANKFDQLFFASDRIGASVGDIQAFSYAVSQMGGTAQGAQAALEGLARKMRDNPGTAQQINAATGAHIENGKLTLKILEDMGKSFQKMSDQGHYYTALQRAESWGIDEKTMRAMMAGVDKFAEQYKEKMKAAGLNPEEAARDAHAYKTAWSSIWSSLETDMDAALAMIVKGGGGATKELDEALTANAKDISEAIKGIVEIVGSMVVGFVEAVGGSDDLKTAMGNIAKSIKEVTHEIRWLIDEFKLLFEYLESKWSIVTKLKELNDALSPIKWGAKALGYASDHINGGTSSGSSSTGDAIDSSEGKANAGKVTESKAALAKESYDFWISKGLTPAQAAGVVGMEQGESQFDPNAVGDGGAAKGSFQWHADRRANIKAATGIDISNSTHQQQLEAAWWEFNNTEKAAFDKIKNSKTAGQAAAAGVTYYERPADKAGQSAVRGQMANYWANRFADKNVADKGPGVLESLGKMFGIGASKAANAANTASSAGAAKVESAANLYGMAGAFKPGAPSPFSVSPSGVGGINSWNNPSTTNHVNQKVEIKVDGSGDPHAVGAAVGANMDRVNADIIRNLQGASN